MTEVKFYFVTLKLNLLISKELMQSVVFNKIKVLFGNLTK